MRRGRRGRRVGGRCSAAAVPLGTSPPPTDTHGGLRSCRVAVASGVRACWLGVVVVRGGARASSKRRESRYFCQALRRKARPTRGWMRWASGPCARTHRVMLTHRPKLMGIEWRKLRIRYACGSVKYQILIFRVLHIQFRKQAGDKWQRRRALVAPTLECWCHPRRARPARDEQPGRRGRRVVGAFARRTEGGAQRRRIHNERILAHLAKSD